MGNVVLFSSVSLDGYIEGPNRDIGWHLVDAELHDHFNRELDAMGAFLSGRITHELMAGFWPTADEDPDSSPSMVEFARIWKEKPKFVYSRSLEKAEWNTTVVREVVPEEVRELKERFDGDVALSGADLAAEFLDQGLVDEFRIYVHPVVIGAGKPLFAAFDRRIPLDLVGTHEFGNGVVLLHYRRPTE